MGAAPEDPYAERELRDVAHALDLDDLALKDLLADDGRAKYEEVGQARLVITNAVSVDHDRPEITVHPLSIIATDRALICLAGDTEALRPARSCSGQTDKLATDGIEAALQLVLNAVISTYEAAVDWLEQRSDQLADLLFDEHPLDKPSQLRAFRLRKALSALRQLTEPMRTVLDDLVQAQPPAPKAEPRPIQPRPSTGSRSTSTTTGSPMPPTGCARPSPRSSTPAWR